MDERPRVLLALSPPAEQAVESLLFAEEAPLQLVASAAEAAELERLASEHEADAVLVSPDLPDLTPAHGARLRARGLRLVGLALDEQQAATLSALGADTILAHTANLEELRAALAGGDQDEDGAGWERRRRADLDDVVLDRGEGAGSLLAVVGSRGAPGASECAASLAALAAERWPALLVECDLLGGGLDLRLAADAHEGSLLGPVRARASGDGALGELLERWLVQRPGWPPVLLAPPEPQRMLAELSRPGALAAALRALSMITPLLVCDVGALLDEGGEAGRAARAHREPLVCADAALLVLGARERQLRDGLAQLDLLLDQLEIPKQRLRVVCNGSGGPGASPARALTEALAERLAERGLALDATLPFDGRALRRAEKRGLSLATARRHGPYARALRRLLDELFLPVAAAKPRERKQRLPAPQPAPSRDEEVTLPWRSS